MKSIRKSLGVIAVFTFWQCASVTHQPVSVSTRSTHSADAKILGTVQHEECHYVFSFLPAIRDYREMYDRLLEKAEKKGGNSIVDFQLQYSDKLIIIPFLFIRFCDLGTGQAANIQ